MKLRMPDIITLLLAKQFDTAVPYAQCTKMANSPMKFGEQVLSPNRPASDSFKLFVAAQEGLIFPHKLIFSLPPSAPLLLDLPVLLFSYCLRFPSFFLYLVGHLSDHPPKRRPEGPGWDELHDPVSVGVQHRPH